MSYSLSISSFSRTQWQLLAVFYLSICLVYYTATWYVYGGFGGGHMPYLSIEEFWAAAGTKFTVFFTLTLFLIYLAERLSANRGRALLLFQLIALPIFVLLADLLQDGVNAIFGWVLFFGGRLSIFNDLLAGGFYAFQFSLLLLISGAGTGAGPQVQKEPTEHKDPPAPTRIIIAFKGADEVPLAMGVISHLTASGNYTEAYVEGKRYLLRFGIGKAVDKFVAIGFQRIHRSHLVNWEQVIKISRKGRRYFITLTDGTTLPVGKSYVAALRELRG